MKRKLMVSKIFLLFVLLCGQISFAQTKCGTGQWEFQVSARNCGTGYSLLCEATKSQGNLDTWYVKDGPNGFATTIPVSGKTVCIPVPYLGNYKVVHYVGSSYAECIISVPFGVSYVPSMPTATTLDNRDVDKRKPVGTIQGGQAISLTGGGTYSIPISYLRELMGCLLS